MKLSIIVPVYNTEKYLSRCIQSLINQTLEDKEIILVDDGSNDNSPQICDNYAKEYEFIKVIHKENGGLSSARNAGLDVSQGDFIGFTDSDDCVHRDFYKILVGEAQKNACDIAQMKFRCFEGENPPIDEKISDYKSQIKDSKNTLIFDYCHMKHNFETSVCVKVFKKRIFNNIRFCENIPYLEDVYLKPEILLASEKFIDIDLNLYYYFKNNKSLVSTRKNKKHSNILVDLHINDILWNENVCHIIKITENRLFSVLYTFSKINDYYDKNLLENLREKIVDFYDVKIPNLNNVYIKFLYKLFYDRKYKLLNFMCKISFDLYKKFV